MHNHCGVLKDEHIRKMDQTNACGNIWLCRYIFVGFFRSTDVRLKLRSYKYVLETGRKLTLIICDNLEDVALTVNNHHNKHDTQDK